MRLIEHLLSARLFFFYETSLVVQWLGIRLAVQEMQVQSLVGELRSHMPRGSCGK